MSTEPIHPDADLDSSPYIRTYAKDLAAMSPTTQGAQTTTKQTAPAPQPKQTIPGVTLPEVDESLITHIDKQPESIDLEKMEHDESSTYTVEQISASQPSYKEEVTDLPRIQTGDIIQKQPQPVVAPEMAPMDAERAAILARLKAKVQQNPPPAPKPTPVPPPAPVPTPEPEPVFTAPHVAPKETPEPFHSLTTDFQDKVQKDKANAFTVLAAEKDSSKVVVAPKKKVNLAPILIGVLLLVIGSGTVFAAYRFLNSTAPVSLLPSVPSLIAPDETKQLNGTGSALLQALGDVANQPLVANNVLVTYISAATTTKQGTVAAPQSGGALIAALNLPAPDILLRNINDESTVGVVHAGDETRAFFILRVSSYERTYAGMLNWEPTIASDLVMLYPLYPTPPAAQAIPIASSTTATTTKPVTPAPTFFNAANAPTRFTDAVVASHDVRVLKDTIGRTLVLYGYADKQTLIIARDEAAFTLLLNRLTASQK